MLIQTPLNKYNEFDLKELLTKVRSLGFSRIFLETGIKLTNNFLDNNLVDVFHLLFLKKILELMEKIILENQCIYTLKRSDFSKRKLTYLTTNLYHTI